MLFGGIFSNMLPILGGVLRIPTQNVVPGTDILAASILAMLSDIDNLG